jgi:hypothetical protein
MPSNSKPAAGSGPISIILVERNGDLRASQIDAYTPLELCKKCKYKTSSGFEIRAEWAYSGPTATDERFMVELWAREDGNAGQENKYEFPPPVDTILFFGACALVAKDMSSQHRVIPLTLEKWDKMYDFLFGGFDTLVNCEDDDNEEDELDLIPAHRKTKDGYLKDGFVVDNSGDDDDDDKDDEEDEDEEDEDEDEEDEEDEDADDDNANDNDDADDDTNGIGSGSGSGSKNKIGSIVKGKLLPKRREKKQEVLVDTSSELGEETYEYLDD